MAEVSVGLPTDPVPMIDPITCSVPYPATTNPSPPSRTPGPATATPSTPPTTLADACELTLQLAKPYLLWEGHVLIVHSKHRHIATGLTADDIIGPG